MSRRAARFVIVVGALLLAVGAAAWWALERAGVQGWTQRSAPVPNRGVTDAQLRAVFRTQLAAPRSEAYELAFAYLLEGFVNYRSALGARAYYPGTPSKNGRASDGLEGFARFFPLAGAWLASGRADEIDIGGRTVSISRLLREGLIAGTDRDGPEFWGVITSGNQRLFESADVALGVWLTRERIWSTLDPTQRRNVTQWLHRALEVDAFEGNWSLIPVTVRQVLRALGEDSGSEDVVVDRYWRDFKKLAIGGGWIADGAQGADHYNAWAMQYLMFWIDLIDPSFDPAFIRDTNRDFVAFYQYLMSLKGAPLMGRSVCYRMATPVPLLTAQVLSPGVVSAGRAMRALDATWSFFVGHGAMANGAITQGFCGTDLALVNDYTSPASCLWSARGLLLALFLDRDGGLLSVPREPLPVELGDYTVPHRNLKWRLEGTARTGEVAWLFDGNPDGADQPVFQAYTWRHALGEWLGHRPQRPDNHRALYERRRYTTEQSFTRCDAVTD
jgi:hypothetical protein